MHHSSAYCVLPAVLLAAAVPSAAHAAASLELYGTFHAMGVIVTIDAGDDPDLDAVAEVSYRSGGAAFVDGHRLVRTGTTRFVGSLFWLDPGVTYDVRVAFDDPGGTLHGQTVQASHATRAEITIPAPTASLYASPNGSGAACTLASPCALDTALDQVLPGEEVVLRGGVYRTGNHSVARSGSPGAPIVIRPHTGESPVLDGADPEDFTWTHQGGGVYRTTVNVADPHLVAADDERLYPYQSLADLQSLRWDVPGFFANGTTVSVRLANDANPNTAEMVVSRFNRALYLDQDLIYVIGLGFQFYGQGSWAKAIYLDGASDNLVRGCTFITCDLGVGIKRASHRNVIEDNVFTDTIFDWPWDAVKAGSQLESGGVRMYDPMTGRGTVIRRNTFADDFDGFGVCPASDTGTTCETDVYDNLGYDLGDDGVETDGYCANVRLWGNTFHHVLMGISLAPVYHGPVYAVRNLIHSTGVGNHDYTGSCFKLNSGYDTSGPMLLYHNTCDAALPGNDAFRIGSPGTWTALTARNNIWSATRYALVDYNTSQPVDLDHDAVYTSWANELAWWDGHGHLRTLPELQAATGQEMHGLHVEPGFAGGSYRLDPTSNLVDAGLLLPGINHDHVGGGPDIGAFELGEPIFTDGFESGDTTAW
jgi:hypothetical protein